MIGLLTLMLVSAPEQVMVLPVSTTPELLRGEQLATLEDIATKVVGQETGACVVTPNQMRAIKRRPDPKRELCGLPAGQVVMGPWYFHTKVSREGGRWRLSAQLLNRLTSVPVGKADVHRNAPEALIDSAPAMFRAVAAAVHDAPLIRGRLLGVVGSVPRQECPRHAVDTEAIVGWDEPGEWHIAEYGRAEAATRSRDLAMLAALLVATREAVEGGFIWILAQLSERDRATIQEHSDSFEQWSTGEVARDFDRYVISREVKETREEKDSREARLLVRTCLDTKRIRAAVREEVTRLRR